MYIITQHENQLAVDHESSMKSAQSLQQATFVVPCFNEEERLEVDQIADFIEQTPYLHIIFVDDGSCDRTLDVLFDLRSEVEDDRITILSLSKNGGKAEAIRQGVLHAFGRKSNPNQWIGYFDADLATPLDQLIRLVDVANRLDRVDAIIGCRLSLSGHQVDRTPGRRILGRLFSFVASRSVGVALADTQCGAKLFRANTCFQKIFRQPFCSRWFFDVEILARMRSIVGVGFKSKIFEMPLESWQEVDGSKLRATNFFQAPWELLRIIIKYRLKRWNSQAVIAEETQVLVVEEVQPVILPFPQRSIQQVNVAKAA